jgi:hypothetical protein
MNSRECEVPAEPKYETILGSRRSMAIEFRSSSGLTGESPIAAYA